MILSPAKTLNLDDKSYMDILLPAGANEHAGAGAAGAGASSKNPRDTTASTRSNKVLETSEPSCNVGKTNELVNVLKNKSKSELKTMMKISDKIASSVFKVRIMLMFHVDVSCFQELQYLLVQNLNNVKLDEKLFVRVV